MRKWNILCCIVLALCLMLPCACAQESSNQPLAELRELPPVGVQGFSWLSPVRGEKLFIGRAKVSQAERMYLAFIVSADGKTLSDILIYFDDMHVKVKQGLETYVLTKRNHATQYTGKTPIKSKGFDLLADNLYLTNVTISGDSAQCQMAYLYPYEGSLDPFIAAQEIPFDTVTVHLENFVIPYVASSVPPPSKSGVNALGFKLPDLADGETLYLGEADVTQADRMLVAFVLSDGGNEIHDLTFYISGLSLTFQNGNTTVHFTGTSITQTISGTFAVAETARDIELGDTRITGMRLSGDEALGTLAYTYHYTDAGGSAGGSTDVPFDLAEVRFGRQ